MILYKYVKPDGVDIVENLRIKVGNPNDFNDPFEFEPSIIDISQEQFDINTHIFNNDPYLQRVHNYKISQGETNLPYESFVTQLKNPGERDKILKNILNIAKTLRITCKELKVKSGNIALMACFCGVPTESSHEILMWSYYTDAHKGLRIAFNTDFLKVQGSSFIKVKYESKRLQLNPLDHFTCKSSNFKDVYYRAVGSKSSIWSHENEYRWVVSTELCKRGEEYFFAHINPKAIEEIVCGVQCKTEQVSIIKNLVWSKLGNQVKVKKAEIDDYEFKLKYVEV